LIFNFIETRRPQLNHINLAPTIPYTEGPAHVKFGYKEKGQNGFNIQNGKILSEKKKYHIFLRIIQIDIWMYPTCSYSLQAHKAIEIASRLRLMIDPVSWHGCSLK